MSVAAVAQAPRITGRFAPSPTADLHLGNLRTAVVAWLFARAAGGRFLLRIEDLDAVASRPEIEERQRRDLDALGLDWDDTPLRQSERQKVYRAALDRLDDAGLTYPCYCTRREIRDAARAPHGPIRYPGTCRQLGAAERADREAAGRPSAIRFRSDTAAVEFADLIAGHSGGAPDDVVIWRNDGGAAYNLAVVVDDGATDVTQVVRGDDLLDVTPTQIALANALGLPLATYGHVPLVYGPSGQRLAKRDGAVTLTDLAALGWSANEVLSSIGASLGLCEAHEPVSTGTLLDRFDPETPIARWMPDIVPSAADSGRAK